MASKEQACGGPVAGDCWSCPASYTEFVDPVAALKQWRRLPFCASCLGSLCVCDPTSVFCFLDFKSAWQLRG